MSAIAMVAFGAGNSVQKGDDISAENEKGRGTEEWYYAIPFVLIWLLVIGPVVKAIWF